MIVDKIEYSPSFGQIKLTRKETIKVNNLLNDYRKGKTDGIFEQLTDIFTPHLEKEAKNKTNGEYIEKDFLQELHIRLFEIFSKFTDKTHPAYTIVKRLNKINPSKNEAATLPKHIPLEQLSKEDEEAHTVNMLFASETAKGRAKIVTETSQLTQRERQILEEHLYGKKFQDIADTYDLTRDRIKQIHDKVILQIKLIHNRKYRMKYFKDYPTKRKLFADKFNLKFTQNTKYSKIENTDNFRVTNPAKTKEIPVIRKKIRIRPETILTKSDIDSRDIIVYKKAKLKQDGIVTGNIENHGLYNLTGLTGGNIKNYGEMNLEGIAEHKIENFGKMNLTGTARDIIVNKGDTVITGEVQGNIINSGNLDIYGKVKGDIYTYNNKVNISDNAEITGKIIKLEK